MMRRAYMNAHIDFKHDYNGGGFLQHISRMPGDFGPVYTRKIPGDEITCIRDTNVHRARIEVKDAYNNFTNLHFLIQHDGSAINPIPETSQQSMFLSRPGERV